MACQEYEDLMMAYLDNELDDKQRRAFEEHLETCPKCRTEVEEFKRIIRVTEEVTLAEPEDRIWQQYWAGIYNRIERGVGWILMSVGGILLIIYGGFKAIEDIVKDPTVGLILKIALLILIAGLAVLFVSVLRERLYFWKKDRYKDIRR